MASKICTKCGQEKPLEEFKRKKSGRYGLAARCRSCCSVEYHEKKDYYAKKNRIWIQNNRERYNKVRRKWRRIYYQTTERMKRRTPEERAKRKKRRDKYRKNICYVINNRMRARIHRALLGKKAGRHWEVLVGYTASDLIQHLESLFKHGMGWHNYGDWHIDHRIPIAKFNITSAECEDFKKCWALKNLQPLWALENLRKGMANSQI